MDARRAQDITLLPTSFTPIRRLAASIGDIVREGPLWVELIVDRDRVQRWQQVEPDGQTWLWICLPG